jgi:hypothetical protein
MRLLRLIASRMRQRGFVVEHLSEIAHIEKAAAGFAFEKNSASLNGGPPVCLPMIFPRGIVGVTASSLSCLAFARFDRNLGFRAVTCPLDRAQDTSLRFIRDQSQQLSIFLVRLLKGESPISHGARVTHGISTPRNTGNLSTKLGIVPA